MQNTDKTHAKHMQNTDRKRRQTTCKIQTTHMKKNTRQKKHLHNTRKKTQTKHDTKQDTQHMHTQTIHIRHIHEPHRE